MRTLASHYTLLTLIDVLQELYESRGRTYVTVIPSPQPGTLMDGQIACYNTCFEMASNYTDWFIVIVRICTNLATFSTPFMPFPKPIRCARERFFQELECGLDTANNPTVLPVPRLVVVDSL